MRGTERAGTHFVQPERLIHIGRHQGFKIVDSGHQNSPSNFRVFQTKHGRQMSPGRASGQHNLARIKSKFGGVIDQPIQPGCALRENRL